MDLKPVMYQDVRKLDPRDVKVEEIRRNSLLKEVNCTKCPICCLSRFKTYVNDTLLYVFFLLYVVRSTIFIVPPTIDISNINLWHLLHKLSTQQMLKDNHNVGAIS